MATDKQEQGVVDLKRTPREIKVMSMYASNAYSVMLGHKLIENRSTPTNYRGVLFIHVSKTEILKNDGWNTETYYEKLDEFEITEDNPDKVAQYHEDYKKIYDLTEAKQIPYFYPSVQKTNKKQIMANS